MIDKRAADDVSLETDHLTGTVDTEKPALHSLLHHYDEFIIGSAAAWINITVTFPLNKVMFRQQLYGISLKSAVGQLKHEGLHRLYRGLLPPLLQKTAALSLMFGTYHQYYIYLSRSPFVKFWPHPLVQTCAAIMAGCTEATLVPFERVQTILQDRTHNYSYTNTLQVARALRQYGFREYYRGLTAVVVRNGPSNAMFFVGRHRLKKAFPRTESQLMEVVQNFTSGAILGAFISTVFYPVNVIKTRMQCRIGGRFQSVIYTFKVLVDERGGIGRLFRGVHINFTRSLVSWGIINASYEFLKELMSNL